MPTVAPLIFNNYFFPADDPFVAIMLAWFGNALTFFFRPFGGIVFAHIGDRIGR
ncbi:MHS family MFS transporter [Enemella dayhoffiae]|uniref:MHS family MFS transporter n=1 Tax=Enemella dayhoffiae TaxID=2016507 RepID=UPI0011405317|nr:MHS family MFS transporter [Enemella dayhoffiae]